MSYTIQDWEGKFRESNLTNFEIREKLIYVNRAYEHKVPVILDINHLAALLGLKTGILSNMINKPSAFYREFDIPKKRGGFRKIVTPHRSLLEVQQWISNNIFSNYKIHPSAFAYVKNKNIAKNAARHIGCKEMLKMDLKDFFPSITFPRVRELFNRVGYSRDVAYFLTSLCCLRESIPQGAATSPVISNIILNSLDKRLYNFSRNHQAIYTRYADDLTFSGKSISDEFRDIIAQNVKNSGFTVNTEKTIFYSVDQRKLVTGVLVKKYSIRLPKSKRKQIRKEVHYLQRFGVIDQVKRHNDIFYVDRVLGRLSFWKQIEPNNKFVLESLNSILKNYQALLNSDK